MSSRRVPLSSNPNAANSPYRAVTAAATKQKRSYATIQREDAYGQPPPAKKQMLDSHQTLGTPPRQKPTQTTVDSRVYAGRNNPSEQHLLERKGVALRDRSVQQPALKVEKPPTENLGDIRQWQKHYRRVFPKFVFYFESVPEDVRQKHTKQVLALGAVSLTPNFSVLVSGVNSLPARGEILLKRSHSRCDHAHNSARDRMWLHNYQ